ncbi:MAG: DUF4373 domain-containing protein [Gammaproteobacteria bacterium]|nr:DUF4373 domain-containing protein [Gammaproteobacteria bacterium]
MSAALPLQKNSCYFSHDADAKDDLRCAFLIDDMGPEGYGIFWILVETLRGQKDYRYPLRLVPTIARKYNTTPSKVADVIQKYELFKLDEESFFFSESLNRRMSFFEQKKKQQVEAGKKSAKVRQAKREQQLLELSVSDSTERPSNDPSTIKLKETKLKETKRKETLSLREGFEKFRNEFKKIYTKQEFYVNGGGFDGIPLVLNLDGLIMNARNLQFLPKKTAFEIWDYLYNNQSEYLLEVS